jgi:pimeloyl-ACP methyl ester carboxylesterase
MVRTPNPILIGLSFGGIMAIEVARLIPVKKLIIIASVKQRKELPFYFRFAGNIPLHRIIPAGLMKWPNSFSNWFFGAQTKEDKKTLAGILNDTDPVFLKWAIHALVNWKNDNIPPGIIHIHGSADKVLPVRYVDAAIIIENGNHLMTLNKPAELNKVLKKLLA